MRPKLFVTSLIVLLGIGLSVAIVSAQGPAPRAPGAAMGTAFTYQGQLKKSGSPVNSTCDFQFQLWDASVGGTILALVNANSVSVVNGLFTRQINFGGTMLNGDARWLEIWVKCSGEASFTGLARQPLTPTPYALALPGLYTQQNATSPNLIGGYSGNSVTMGTVGATIGGGGLSGAINRVTEDYGTVGGGYYNTAGGDSTTVGGGRVNTANGYDATIGGGSSNTTSGDAAAIGGGISNTASNNYATVCGGSTNTAGGSHATVPGGSNNAATGSYSFAAGRRAKANHSGAFVWGDSTDADVVSSFNNEFVIRATNGVRLTADAGPNETIFPGQYFGDNAIIAWASVWANGTLDDNRFGVNATTSTRLGTGRYQIDVSIGAGTGGSLIPIAIAEVDAAPTSAATARIVTINQVGTYRFEVYINDGNWNLVDNDFVFIVTGR